MNWIQDKNSSQLLFSYRPLIYFYIRRLSNLCLLNIIPIFCSLDTVCLPLLCLSRSGVPNFLRWRAQTGTQSDKFCPHSISKWNFCCCQCHKYSAILLKVTTTNNTGHKVSSFTHFVYNGDVKAERIDSMMPAWEESAFIFPKDFRPDGGKSCMVKARFTGNQSKCHGGIIL